MPNVCPICSKHVGFEAMYVHPSDQPLYLLQDAGLGDDERALLQAVDGHKTVATLRALALLPPLETDRLLFASRCAQMIELRERAASGKPKPNIARLAEAAQRPPPLPPQPSLAASIVYSKLSNLNATLEDAVVGLLL